MKYIIENSKVKAIHSDDQEVRYLYPGLVSLSSTTVYKVGDTISDLAILKTACKDTVKEVCKRKIFLIAPVWKQNNYIARSVELLKLRVLNGSWTSGEQTEVNAIQAIWDRVKALRSYSDTKETSIDAAADSTALFAINLDTGWPE